MMILYYYLVAINIISWFAYGIDKRRAIRKQYRISERSLLVVGFFGGCIGSLFGMICFRHKIRKTKFWVVNIFLSIALGYLLYQYNIA